MSLLTVATAANTASGPSRSSASASSPAVSSCRTRPAPSAAEAVGPSSSKFTALPISWGTATILGKRKPPISKGELSWAFAFPMFSINTRLCSSLVVYSIEYLDWKPAIVTVRSAPPLLRLNVTVILPTVVLAVTPSRPAMILPLPSRIVTLVM
ncbi:hypothetical protein D3C85_964010 [compost metagenome]